MDDYDDYDDYDDFDYSDEDDDSDNEYDPDEEYLTYDSPSIEDTISEWPSYAN